jgi:hypothetical protein
MWQIAIAGTTALRSTSASITMSGAVHTETEEGKTIMRTKRILAGMLFLGVVGCTSISPKPNDIPANIANAASPADHQRIADYFTQKANEYEAEAALHERIGKSYINRPKGDPGSMTSHCRALREQFLVAAKEARALAEEHRQIGAKGGT